MSNVEGGGKEGVVGDGASIADGIAPEQIVKGCRGLAGAVAFGERCGVGNWTPVSAPPRSGAPPSAEFLLLTIELTIRRNQWNSDFALNQAHESQISNLPFAIIRSVPTQQRWFKWTIK